MTTRIEDERIAVLNDDEPAEGDYVLYWMQQSQRAQQNPALEWAVQTANERGEPVVVGFGLWSDYPESNARHKRFLLQGLRDVRDDLAERGIGFVVQCGEPVEVALTLSPSASVVVCDRGYLRHQRAWRDRLADEAGRQVVQVEGDVVVPVETVSDKREYAARTIRPKIHKHLERFVVDFESTEVKHRWGGETTPGDAMDLSQLDDPDAVLASLNLDTSVPPNPQFVGGSKEAYRLWDEFVHHQLKRYDEHRNQPQTDDVSHMSKYLHYGQISPVHLAYSLHHTRYGNPEDRESYIEEVVVRRELTHNFCEYCKDYDAFSCLPDWSRKTLEKHKDDEREHVYTAEELEQSQTHDPYWNAAMKEMRVTGYMHNYMRMYWGKKIMEWTNTPGYAYRVMLELNNKYFIDGRDPNSYANVAWCFGNHDRPWTERPIFGTTRYMNANGLKRKCDPEAYVEKVDRLADAVSQARGDA